MSAWSYLADEPTANLDGHMVGGLTYLFCSDGCRSEFLTDPPRFLRKRCSGFLGSPRTL